MFDVYVLPAHRGDCLWIEYGPADHPLRILVDGGITKTGREDLRAMIDATPKPFEFELLVVTHIDLDHVEGIIELLQNLPPDVGFKEIWFNGWDQLKRSGLEPFGVKEGIILTGLLEQKHPAAWNKSTNGEAVALDEDGKVTRHELGDGMQVTVLGPSRLQLSKLREKWHEIVEELARKKQAAEPAIPPGLEALGPIDVFALAQSRFQEDDSVTNGSSIALCLEYAEKKLLLLADAHPSVVEASIRKISPEARFRVNAVKLSHHGSRRNTSLSLVSSLSAPNWIVSSDGTGSTKHPNREAIARILVKNPERSTLVFNYKTKSNELWDNANLKRDHSYDAVFGDGAKPVLVRLEE